MKTWTILAAGIILFSGCSMFSNGRIEDAAWYHMRLADSLEQRMAYREATLHYESVAVEYPLSTAYPVAVRRVAQLYASEFNEARNDSTALRWFTLCLGLPLKKSERENVQTFISLLRRTRTLREDLARRSAAVDSLTTLSRRQTGTIGADARRLQELETELVQAQKELTKMRDIDLRLSKNRGRK
jgi:hypothetical protein